MSVLIKGMKMPANCDDCDFVQHSYPEDWCYLTEKNLPCNCPLVPVPPHGRLIDAEWINEMVRETLELLIKDEGLQGSYLFAAFSTLGEMIKDAPTILEAEVEE